ncbi:coiled-coil domain-containing protein 9-like protein, partial [Leptotrombidium deliense]
MSERKVLNKYYPPDFDPSKIPRLRLAKTRQYTVRIMTPCNMRCNTCGDYISKAKKFNARKETVESESYLGLKIFRFYFKCPKCMAEITFKTDPKSCDYELEHGATRNFQALRLAEQQAEREAKEKEEEEKLNPMKMLENRTKASRREMEELEALEELKDMSQRQIYINYEDILERKKKEMEELRRKQEEEDDEYARSVFRKPANKGDDSSSDEDIPKSGLSFFKNKNEPASEVLASGSSKDNSTLKRKLDVLV